ncbi:uncharacterized protein LOC117964756 isoform X2 [Acipenser ruthenus]|uniref:uncharacterized protein LOC117964756 isoform X2 n=1 Tax=Acipenser ruthenus TaxID=7906 RepID=UPI0027420403|nr:uncharacterized protein LOC117964756 isoform X2 [Acipenser ruthenus]
MAEFSFTPPPPFLALPGEPPVPWARWLDSFNTYLLAMGLEDVANPRKRAILIHCLGTEGQRVFLTLGPASTFDEAVGVLAAHFGAAQSVLIRRFKFRQRSQRPANANGNNQNAGDQNASSDLVTYTVIDHTRQPGGASVRSGVSAVDNTEYATVQIHG